MTMEYEYSIGHIPLTGPFFLAPLAGITDSVMRTFCGEMGAALTYTEMISAKGLFYGDKKTSSMLYISDEEGPVGVQIFGSEPEVMGFAASNIDKTGAALIDINMGCPVPKVVKNGDGAALIKDPELVYKVVRAVCDNTSKPVTVKIRKGFDENNINAVEVAEAIEAAGASAVCVHGRTREQYYNGTADWDIISRVKNAVRIKVIGNGDVFSADDALRMIKETGCDFVMVARGALGNPWIFRDLNRALAGEDPLPDPSREELFEMMIRHLDGLVELKGEYRAVREMRKHIAWYTKGIPGASKLRGSVNDIDTVAEMKEVLTFEKKREQI